MESLPLFLTVQQCADLAGFSWKTVRRAIDEGALRAFEPRRGQLRIERSDFWQWMTARVVAAASPAAHRQRRVAAAPVIAMRL